MNAPLIWIIIPAVLAVPALLFGPVQSGLQFAYDRITLRNARGQCGQAARRLFRPGGGSPVQQSRCGGLWLRPGTGIAQGLTAARQRLIVVRAGWLRCIGGIRLRGLRVSGVGFPPPAR